MKINKIERNLKAAGFSVVSRKGVNCKRLFVKNLVFSQVFGEKTVFVFEIGGVEMFPVREFNIEDDGSLHLLIIDNGKLVEKVFWELVPTRDMDIINIIAGGDEGEE